MNRPVVIIRPQPGLSASVAEARELGMSVVAAPMFAVESRRWDGPPAEGVDALLIGSGNAIRHGGAALDLYAGKPVYAVGASTAQAARNAGFPVAGTGDGGLQQVLDQLAGQSLRLLRLAGEEHVPLTAPSGIELVTRIVYVSVALPMPNELAETLRRGAIVLLHSAAASRHFAMECRRLNLDQSRIALAALGPRIAEAAGEGWDIVEIAATPSNAALLALARDMCHPLR